MSNRRRASSPVADQVDAALAESRLIFGLEADRRGRVAPLGAAADAWVLGIYEDVNRAAEAGLVDYCQHAANPRPLHVGAWNRRLVVCSACVGLLRLYGEEDRRCDRCAAVVETIMTTTGWAENVLFVHIGLCWDCTVELGVPVSRAVVS